MIKTYRGLLADGSKQTINLHTNNGKIGYRIKKLQVMPAEPGKYTQEITVQVFSVPQTAVGVTVDFSDHTLLAAAIYAQSSDSFNSFQSVIFDNVKFNQDIYLTLQDTQNADGGNYYLELEQMDLTEVEALVAIVKNLRSEQE